ncbi:hypothetical protein DBV05_g1164 [Lasiodiplodia theobromae]|uniref:Rhodopsin domain-containing protein n=1 Tax=Lasiodiplodia theobromae TaxID=45133 RepID=A0A5N5DRF4_9PEZI|nr:hypothetical protein DBV05_g1164 [Lasiodiplodia theobromae]
MASSSTADEDRRWIVLTMVCLALTLGLSSLALRGYVKLRVRKMVTADDWIMLIAGLLWLGYMASQIAACANGFGAHTADLRQNSYYYVVGTAHNGDVVEALRFWFVSTLLHIGTTAVVRLSASLTVLGQPHPRSTFRRWTVILNLAIVTLASIAFAVLLALQCTPLSAYWSRNRAEASSPSCHFATTVVQPGWYGFAALSLVANLVLAFFALTPVLQAGLSWRKRAPGAVLNLFSVTSVVMSALQLAQVPTLRDTADLSFAAGDFASYALLVPSLALVAANLAGLGPWVKELGWDAEGGEARWREGNRGLRMRTLGRRRGRSAMNVMRGHGEEGDEAVLEAAIEEGLGRLESTGAEARAASGSELGRERG